MSRDLFAAPATRVARVALPLPIDRLFDYAVPDELASRVEVGRRVRAAVGGRRLTGVIVELLAGSGGSASSDGRELRPLEAVIDSEPVLGATLLSVLRAEAHDALCPLGIALASALPSGSAPRSVRVLALTRRGREALERGAVRGEARALLARLAEGGMERRALPAQADTLRGLERDGLAHWTQQERGPRVRAARVRVASLREGMDAERACQEELRRAPRQAALLRLIASEGPLTTAALAKRQRGASASLRALAARNLVRVESRAPALVEGRGFSEEDRELVLTDEQRAACGEIGAAIRSRDAQTFLLHGVTGSGKTEVYLRAVSEALALGRQALVLVPEITLTHQILGRLRARFGRSGRSEGKGEAEAWGGRPDHEEPFAILHSGLRPGERLAQWEQLRRGATPIAVGARSVLFAPLRDLGVIVVDEEHDAAYKNDEGFRYHARSLAQRLARASGCPLVLGSATPSLETRYAAEQGEVRRLRLRRRIGGRPLPAVEIIDLARERAALPRGRKLIFSSALARSLRETLASGGQSILFLNRRGFSTQIACFECQDVARCKHCDISLTYHAADQRLRCHYCDYQTPPPDVCARCGAPSTALLGIGTERLEEEVRIHLPEARVARLDRDTSARRGAAEEILSSLRAGELDVLVGTQMVAKGHDFSGVALVGVVNADLGLHFPDFRAAERTFQLLTQVAGRAGRGATPGRVIVQTYVPDHYAVRPVIEHDFERFFREELQHRRLLGYPPFSCLARVLVSGPDEDATREAAERLAGAARTALAAGGPGETTDGAPCEILGPAPAPIARLRGRHRFQLLIKHETRERVWSLVRRVSEAAATLRGDLRTSVDMSPVDML